MPSIGDKATASAEKRVQERLVKIYSKARKDMMEQMKEFNARFAQKDQEKRAKVKAGQMTQEEYDKWKRMQVLQSDIWRQKFEQATKTLEDANRQALRVINGEKMDVFAENANYEAYRISKDTGIGYGFSVYDKDTVGKLIREQPELMPRKVVNGKKDRAWNRTKISNAVTQSIIQGDSLPEMTERIARETAHENDAAMARYAATAMTSAQNAGRMETMERAKGMGIKVRKKWIAMLDARTRDSHAELDGQVVDIDEPFITHNRDGSLAEIMFPGDPQADGEQVWNCRCTLGYVYEEYPDAEDAERIAAEYYRDEDDNLRSRPAYVKNMSYNEWKKSMQIPPKQKTTQEESELEKKLRKPAVIEQYTPDDWDEKYKHRDEEYTQAIADIKRREADLLERYRKLQPGPERHAISQQLSAITDEQQKVRSSIYNKYGMEETVATLQSRKIPWVPLRRLDKPMDGDAIISKLCGGDETKGSCASLGFAYVGQKAGLDVTDFRGGGSQEVFSRKCVSMLRSFRENGLDVKTGTAKSYVTAGKRVLAEVQEGREYYFECARHAAIVRKVGDELQYLELQSGYQNGWIPFSRYGGIDGTLNRRFGAPKSGRGWEVEAMMMDVEEMGKNERFTKCLGYINTEADKQKKGAGGHER